MWTVYAGQWYHQSGNVTVLLFLRDEGGEVGPQSYLKLGPLNLHFLDNVPAQVSCF
jgi:hypothetical protein